MSAVTDADFEVEGKYEALNFIGTAPDDTAEFWGVYRYPHEDVPGAWISDHATKAKAEAEAVRLRAGWCAVENEEVGDGYRMWTFGPDERSPDAQAFPPEGERIVVLEDVEAREPGEDTMHDIKAGSVGTVIGMVEEWFDVHVEFDNGIEAWICPDNMTPAPREDNA